MESNEMGMAKEMLPAHRNAMFVFSELYILLIGMPLFFLVRVLKENSEITSVIEPLFFMFSS
jgi:hypothetical protein